MSPTAASIVSRLPGLIGPERAITEPDFLRVYAVDGQVPSAALVPDSQADVAEILRFAAAERLGVIPMGGRSKLGIGMPPRQYDMALDMSRMDRVLAYDPDDLTLGVEPGVRYADLDRRLSWKRQFLPLAPAFHDRATLGGIVAAGADTPLRHGYGGVRDYLLGMEFVTGEGATAKSGGRVVKNVTGYDMHKLLIGSLGTLAVITRINFRTFPLPPERRMCVASFSDAKGALELCAAIARSQLQPRLVDVFDPATASLFAASGARVPVERWWVVIEAAGHQAVVERHVNEFGALAAAARAMETGTLDDTENAEIFACISEFPRIVLGAAPNAAIFRIAILPTAMQDLLERARPAMDRRGVSHATLVRTVGIVYIALSSPENDPAGVARLVGACRELTGIAAAAGARPVIEWCPQEVKQAMSVWPAAGNEQALAERLKKAFDPGGILSPGRFQGGL